MQALNRKLRLAGAVLMLIACADPQKRKAGYLQSGAKYAEAGKYQEAVIQFRNAIEIDPKSPDPHFRLAGAYMKLNNRDGAYREIQATVSLDPANSDAQLLLATLEIERREFQQAQAALEKIISADPKNAQAHALMGRKYALTHDLPKAVGEIRKAIELDPRRVENYAALGAIELAAGRPGEAETAYQQAIEANPKSSQARLALGEFYIYRKSFPEAAAQIRAAIELDPHAVPPRLFLGRIYEATGRLEEAENLYRELKTVAPAAPEAYQALAHFYASRGQKEKAAAEFRSLLASRPKDALVKASLIETLVDLNQIKEAESLNQEVLSANAGDALGLLSNGRILIAKHKYQEAATELEKLIHAGPSAALVARAYYLLGVAQKSLGLQNLAKSSLVTAIGMNDRMTNAMLALADLHLENGDYDEAMRVANGALGANPDLPAGYVVIARASLAKGDARQAEGQLEAALQRDPLYLPALAILVKLAGQHGQSQEVLHRISILAQQHPGNAGLQFLVAIAYFDLKDLGKSEVAVRQAITLDPKTPEAYVLLAGIEYAKGAVEQAKTDLRTAIDASPRNIANYLTLESWYAEEGNWQEALKTCEKAHQIDPTSPLVADELALLYLEHGGDVNVALSLAQTAKQKTPHSASAADTLGWAYYKLGSLEPALSNLKESVRLAPDNPLFRYHLGMAYLAGSQPQAAKESLQQAVKNHPHFAYAANARAALDKISSGAR